MTKRNKKISDTRKKYFDPDEMQFPVVESDLLYTVLRFAKTRMLETREILRKDWKIFSKTGKKIKEQNLRSFVVKRYKYIIY